MAIQVQRLILFRFERYRGNRVLDVAEWRGFSTTSASVAVQYEEDNRLQHQNKKATIILRRAAPCVSAFFTEDVSDARAITPSTIRAIYHGCAAAVATTIRTTIPTIVSGEDYEVDRFKVGFGDVAFRSAGEAKLARRLSAYRRRAKRKRGAPAITRHRQPRRLRRRSRC